MTSPSCHARRLFIWLVVSAVVVSACGGRDEDKQPWAQVDCWDLCSKSSECLGADEGECYADCLQGYEDPEIMCLRLCDRQADCFLYFLCAGYCILKD